MRPTRCFNHQAAVVEFREARIPVSLQNSTEVSEMLLRMLASAIGTIREPDRRRALTGGWPLVAYIAVKDPDRDAHAGGIKVAARLVLGLGDGGKHAGRRRRHDPRVDDIQDGDRPIE